ncbi:MAG: replication-associated recombination protein A [Pseudomonadota bacterium]
MDLFERAGQTTPQHSAEPPRPLAERLRPKALTEVVGQAHLLAPDAPLGAMVGARSLSSLILWGPPGVGKTTIARLLAEHCDLAFVQISAIFSGVADLRKVFEPAQHRHAQGRSTLLFVDEIHRFNKAQQDAFLPHMESGAIVLVGATTENPSFELNAALLSRAQVLRLTHLGADDLSALIARAEAALGPLPLTDATRKTLIAMAEGDGRALLNLIEQLAQEADPGAPPLTPEALAKRLSRRAPSYDKSGDGHYNLISALHKSVRGSDPDAALYWLARMLEAGEDPHYLARRLLRMSVEDIGLADPDAQTHCLNAWQVFERLGSPEGELALAQAVLYLALAPKSNAAYAALKAARKVAGRTGSMPPPDHILNAPTALMKRQGFSAGYAYDHDAPDAFSGQAYFPEGMARAALYHPVDRGFEREMKKRLDYFARLRRERGEGDG